MIKIVGFNNAKSMNKKDERFISIAREVSNLSDYKKVKIGAVIVLKREIISVGYNKHKSHPIMKVFNKKYRGFNTKESNIHAEMQALVKCKHINIKGATIYIYRELKDGSLGNCFPCPACQRRIITAGIKRIVYTDYDGIYEMKIRRLFNARLQNKTKI